MEKKNDINYLNNLLHRYVYLNNNKNIEIESIVYKDISIERIKKTDKTIDRNELEKIIESLFTNLSIYKIYEDRIELLNKNTDSLNNLIIISFYKKSDDSLDEINRGENIDKLINLILSEKVINKQINEVILPVMNLDIDKETLLSKIGNNKIKKIINEKHTNDYDNIISVQIKECYNQLIDDINDKYCLIICVLNALEKITNIYPTFRHNNLIKENIYLMETEQKNNTILIKKHKLSEVIH
jgi:hypothetical protein